MSGGEGEGTRGSTSRLTRKRKTGELQSVDGYMNIALEQTREIVEGSGAGGAGGGRERVRRNYGDAFIRGNNGECSLTSCFLQL